MFKVLDIRSLRPSGKHYILNRVTRFKPTTNCKYMRIKGVVLPETNLAFSPSCLQNAWFIFKIRALCIGLDLRL